MKLNSVPPRQGVLWVQAGFRTFAKRPFAFAALLTSVLFIVLLVRLMPALVVLVLPILPVIPLGFMIATRVTLGGGFPTLRVFVEPLRAERPRVIALLKVGLVYAAAMFAMMWLADLLDGGMPAIELDAVPSAASAPDAARTAAADAGPTFGMLLRFGATLLLSIPFWHAPALVYWDGQGCAQALFSSTLACWRNRGAFAVYALMWVGLAMASGVFVSLLVAVLGLPQLPLIAGVAVVLLIASVYYASLYFTFADSFAPNDAGA